MTFKVKVQGLDGLARKLGEAKVVKAVDKGIKKGIIYLEGEAIKETPVDTGVLRNSFRTKFKKLSGEVFNTKKYAIYVHEGTKRHFPPRQQGRGVHNWARRKGLDPFKIALGISRKGTKANPFMDRALKKSEKKIIGFVKKSVYDLVDQI